MTGKDSTTYNWVPIVGHWSVTDKGVQYIDGPQPGSGPTFGICLSDAFLTDGRVSAIIRVSARTEGRFLFGFRSPTEHYVMAGLGGWGGAYTIGEFEPGAGWKPLAGAGSDKDLSTERPYQVAAEIVGQRVKLSIDGVRVLDHQLSRPLSGGQLGLFTWAEQDGEVDFREISIDPQRGTVFVVMAFSEPYKQLYEEIIQPVTFSLGLRAYHVGEVFGPGIILRDIAQGIVDAKVVIAEVTPPNQNVYYELGYAHALNKPTIILAERSKELPFDISGYRVLFYDNTIAGKKQVEEGLRKHLTAILRD